MHALRRRLYHRARTAALAGALLLGCLPPAALALSDTGMREALADAREQRWASIDDSAVAGHILHGYVDYHRLRGALPDASPERVNAFITEHEDSPLSVWMRGQAISAYGEAEQFDDLLAVADGKPAGAERQCHYATALLAQSPTRAGKLGRELWLAGRSRPAACDTLFHRLQSRGVIDGEDVWERAMLA